MKPWNKRLGKSLSPKPLLGAMFGALEDASPAAAHLLRFHSRTHLIQPNEDFDTIYRPVRVLEDRYIRQYEIIRNVPEGSSFSDIEKAHVPIHTAFVENVVIHGHIKAPITRPGSDAIGYYFPFKRLDWGDVYPLPFFKNDYLAGDVIFIPRLTNIFHLLVEHVIPAVTAVIRYRSEIKKKLTIVSQIDFPILSFFVTFFRQLGIDAELRIVSPVEKISAERLIVSRGVPDISGFSYAYSEELAVMSDFIDQAVSKIDVPEVCYIERSQTPRRNILNQDRLIEALSAEGARSVVFNFKNFLNQIAVFRKSKIIISAHGASFTNIIFSTPSQTIVEIFSKNHRDNCYIGMASQHQLNYNILIGSEETGNGHFSIPVEPTIELIRKLA